MSVAWYGFSAHGTTVVPERAGPGRLENVEGVPWTDIIGYHRGWGNTFRGVANTFNWFHFGLPTLSLLDHPPATLGEAHVRFLASGTARVQSIHIWAAHVPVFKVDNLNLSGDFRTQVMVNKNAFLFEPTLKVDGAIGISVGVAFGTQSSDVLFTSAYARFVGMRSTQPAA